MSVSSRLLTVKPLLFERYGHFEQKNPDDLSIKAAIISISFLAINLLNRAHNQCANEKGLLKGLKTLGIEVGLFTSSVILAPAEASTRLALAIILALLLLQQLRFTVTTYSAL